MSESDLTPETQAILLLCGNLGLRGGTEHKPLGPRQYSAMAAWLEAEGLRPADLLDPDGRRKLASLAVEELTPQRVEPLLDRGAALALVVERWQRSGIWIVSVADPAYPQRLRKYLGQAAPPVLFGIGRQSALAKGGLAVVGSRDRTEEDGEFARRVGEHCAKQGIAIISGAAKGIDRDAMGGVLENGGTAIGVLAEGVLKNALSPELREQIADGRLTLVSSYEPEARWFTWTAMERNKFLYGLSDAALVVASGEESGGTWAGATEAIRAGRIRVYVKLSGAAPPGNARLASMGALPFPEEPWSELCDLLTAAEAKEPVERKKAARKPKPVASPQIEVVDAYTLVLPEMLRVLREARDEKTLSAMFQVRAPQMKDWLARAVSEERIQKLTRPARYVVRETKPEVSPQALLFEATESS